MKDSCLTSHGGIVKQLNRFEKKPNYEISWKQKANSNGIGLVMWREEQTTVGRPALLSGRLEDTQGTQGEQRRDGGMT